MRTLMLLSPFYDSSYRVPPGCKQDGWQLFCTQVITSVGICFDSASATSGTPSINSLSKDVPVQDAQPIINAVQGKPFFCYLCKDTQKFLCCPHIKVRLKNEQYRGQFDKVFPPSTTQVTAIASGREALAPASHDNDVH